MLPSETTRYLPYGRQTIDEDDISAVAEVLRGDWLTTGPKVPAFEAAFADQTQARHAVACANGTAALHLAAMALDLGPGDWAVVPAITFVATANAPHFTGARIWFADVDPDTGLLTEDTLGEALGALEALGARAKAAFPVHLNGQCCHMEEIKKVADRYDVRLIEDACHAIGGLQSEGRPVGACAWSDMATFSFHPVKTVTSGEGGMITTNEAGLAEAMTRLRNHGLAREPDLFTDRDQGFDADGRVNPWYYEMKVPGLNYRLSDIHAALGLSQLSKLAKFVERRRALVAHYDEALAPLAPLVRTIGRSGVGGPAWHLYAVLFDFAALGLSRARMMTALQERGIGTQVHYLPVHRQPYYRTLCPDAELPGADSYYERVLSLPLHVGMTTADVDTVVTAIADLAGLDGARA
jgi:UDP-4-amino-4,6-dideoxy-N-acetyl-beta-L-altrosamine transaminase